MNEALAWIEIADDEGHGGAAFCGVGHEHEAAAATEELATGSNVVVSYDDAMEDGLVRAWKREREWTHTASIEKEAIGVLADPSLGAPDFSRRFEHCSPEPTPPPEWQIPGFGKPALLVREDEDVWVEDDQEVTDFLTVPARGDSLIAVNASVTPEREERPLREPLQASFCGGLAIRTRDRVSHFVLNGFCAGPVRHVLGASRRAGLDAPARA